MKLAKGWGVNGLTWNKVKEMCRQIFEIWKCGLVRKGRNYKGRSNVIYCGKERCVVNAVVWLDSLYPFICTLLFSTCILNSVNLVYHHF